MKVKEKSEHTGLKLNIKKTKHGTGPLTLWEIKGERLWRRKCLPIPVHFSLLIPRMSTFTLAIACLPTSNLPWFMDLTSQVPMQYCSLQHQTLLLSSVPSTTGYWFCFGFIPSLFLELFLDWSLVACWAPTDLGSSSSVSYHFAFSYCSWGSQGKKTEVVCHSLLQWTTFCQTSPPWLARLGLPGGHALVSLWS